MCVENSLNYFVKKWTIEMCVVGGKIGKLLNKKSPKLTLLAETQTHTHTNKHSTVI